jgi:hypothetical protein
VVDAELPGNIDEGCDPALNQLVEIVEGLWFIDRRVAEVVLFAQPDECERARRVLSAILARWTAFCGLASRENGVGA